MRASKLWVMPLLCVLLLVGCQRTDYAKIALVAPYEGRYRELGYDVIPAARMALREWAARPEARHTRIELISYDDMGSPQQAAEQARKVTIDADVRVVIGHWLPTTTAEAAPLYEAAGLPLIAFTPTDVEAWRNLSPSTASLQAVQGAWALRTDAAAAPLDLSVTEAAQLTPEVVGGPLLGLDQFAALWAASQPNAAPPPFVTGAALPPHATIPTWGEADLAAFTVAYREASGGAEPGPHSLMAYLATWLAIERIAGEALTTPADGLRFDEAGRIANLPIIVYEWAGDDLRPLEIAPPSPVDSP